MKKGKIVNLLLIGIIFICVFACIVCAVEYDPRIIEAFNNHTEVGVVVRLVDNSDITITGTKEERRNLLIQRDEWFKPAIEEVINTLPATELKNVRKRFNGFSGTITEKSFNMLLNNSLVREIIWSNTPAPHTTDENISTSEIELMTNESEPEIVKKDTSLKFKWLWITIILIFLTILTYLVIRRGKKYV